MSRNWLNTRDERQCSGCKRVLPLSPVHFGYRQDRSLGYCFRCRSCEKRRLVRVAEDKEARAA